jgi:3-phytase
VRSLLAVLLAVLPQDAARVTATVETDPVHHGGDAADDPAIWIHPTDPSRSTVIGDDKEGGLLVYGLDGKEIQWIDPHLALNNVDVRSGFPLAGKFSDGTPHEKVDLVAVGNETGSSMRFYKVHPPTRKLEPAGDVGGVGFEPYGSCLYRSAKTGRFFHFVSGRNGRVLQWELGDDGRGGVAARKVRQFEVGSQVEGCVADDALGHVYVGEEAVGVWKYGAEPDTGDRRASVDRCGKGGHLTADVEGLAIFARPDGTGYLLASSQGNDTFMVYAREGENRYLGAFRVVDGGIDGCSDTDGIEVASVPLGPAFPNGLFVAQDGSNKGGNQNYKLVPWERIASAVSLK